MYNAEHTVDRFGRYHPTWVECSMWLVRLATDTGSIATCLLQTQLHCIPQDYWEDADVLMMNAQNLNKFRFQIKYFVCNENVLSKE